MSKSNFVKRNVVNVTLSDRDKKKLELMAKNDEKSLSEWLRDQITLAYFVRYEQQIIGESLKPVNTTEE